MKDVLSALSLYLPNILVAYLKRDAAEVFVPPANDELETVALFADISGFTKLAEHLATKGPYTGGEQLAANLNKYITQKVHFIAKAGGDVIKFAGDATIVLWPRSTGPEDLLHKARQALQCGLELQANLHQLEVSPGVELSVKVGVGVGKVSLLRLGGTIDSEQIQRLEYIATGDPLIQAFDAEHNAVAGMVNCSKAVWELQGGDRGPNDEPPKRISDFFRGMPLKDWDGRHVKSRKGVPAKVRHKESERRARPE